jgi:AMP-polyphosphate phosphotransferase
MDREARMSGGGIRLIDEGFELGEVDLSQKIDSDAYEKALSGLQKQLMSIQQAYLRSRDRAIIVFEGWDAAGKGGTIRRMSSVMDPRGFKVWPIGAPTPAELEQHYLHRFWARLPRAGEIVVFDRSWYGRVLVERVEELAPKKDWTRAYSEINEFEHLLANDGVRIIKIFLHVSAGEQKKRFIERLRDPLKRWKLSYEDFRNREKWPLYEAAIEEMVERTSTAHAPWRVVASEQKKFGRLQAITALVEHLSEGVDLSPRTLDLDLITQAQEQLGIDPSEALDT